MAVTYCTVEQVASRCNFLKADGDGRAVFGTDPLIPTIEEVQDLINDAEEWINEACRNAWGDLYLQITNELYDIHADYLETCIHLNHTDIMDFDTGEGDKLEIWNGNAWIDWITTYTEARDGDFFVDYIMGKIYFLRSLPRRRRLAARVTYRVNSGSIIPKPISYACSFIVGINILNSEYSTIAFPEGEGEEISVNDIINRWWASALRRLRPYLKAGLPTGTPFQPVR